MDSMQNHVKKCIKIHFDTFNFYNRKVNNNEDSEILKGLRENLGSYWIELSDEEKERYINLVNE